MPPKPYQRDGINFLAPKTRALLGDDAGLGKSMQLIRASCALGAARVLVLTPAVGRGSWALQFAEWDQIARPIHRFPADGPIPFGPCAVIVTLEWLRFETNLKKLLAQFAASGFMDVAFVDEAHNLANDKAKQTRHVYGAKLDLKGGALEHVRGPRWLATATPTPLNVGQLYPHLRALFPDVLLQLFGGRLPNRYAFEERFCIVKDGRFGREVHGNDPNTIPELRAALAPFILMRRKADVLTELPPILTMPLPLDTGFEDPSGLTTDQVAAMSDEEVIAALAAQDAMEGSPRRHLGKAKAEAVMPWVLDFLAADRTRKLIIFGHHKEVLDHIEDVLRAGKIEFVGLRGGLTPAVKDANVNLFQQDPRTRVAVCQNIAAGTAITLTAASTVLIVEPHPTPDQNYQMISRAHRLGQTEPVTAVFAYDAAVALEQRQVKMLRRRARDNEALFGVKTPGVI